MRIYSMTATFGKLEHQTLELKPGLNVIHAPNEWGKSTWCAFLMCMLYGIATRDRSTQTALADKEHYAPWSGSPMSGRIDLQWNGRDITIERSTKGRVPFGEFKAYETTTGLPIPELTAANCGELLLGVEKSVFQKSAFIRMTDMPVSDSEALRRRLNALVTTGDESAESDILEQKLKDLRNRCRHNKTGLLPQAEAQRDAIEDTLRQLSGLREQTERFTDRITELDEQIRLLENHKAALAYHASAADAQRVEAAKADCEQALWKLTEQEAVCNALPTKEAAEEQILHLEQLRMQQESLQNEKLPTPPEKPEVPLIFSGMAPEQAVQQASSDHAAYSMLCKPLSPIFMILSALFLVAGIGAAIWKWWAGIPLLAFGVCTFLVYLRNKKLQERDRNALLAKYPSIPPEEWIPAAHSYLASVTAYTHSEAVYSNSIASYQQRTDQLQDSILQATGGCSLAECLDGWRDTLSEYDELPKLQQAYDQAKKHAEALSAMVRSVPAPAFPDTLHDSPEETQRRLDDAIAEHRHLEKQRSSCLGRMEVIGQQEGLMQQYDAVQTRIQKLQDIYDALTLAIDKMEEVAADLQRRFAPQISRRAEALLSRLTGGRYDRLILTQELQLEAGTQDENNLHTVLWRSDGTADQLYFALRLAVAEELLPHSPLVLDDAFLRFDDTRLSAAMDLLSETAENRQIILFSCQSREAAYLE